VLAVLLFGLGDLAAPNQKCTPLQLQEQSTKGERPTTITLLIPTQHKEEIHDPKHEEHDMFKDTQLQKIGLAATTIENMPHKRNTPWKGG
jgi:hypothetical protein